MNCTMNNFETDGGERVIAGIKTDTSFYQVLCPKDNSNSFEICLTNIPRLTNIFFS